MKIVIIGTSYPMRGGIAHYVALLYQKFIERGHDVKIISFKRQYPSLFFPGKTQQDTSKEVVSLPSEPMLDSIGPLSWIRTFLSIYRFRPDLVIFKYWMPFFAPCYAAVSFLTRLFTRTKLVYICDNIIPHEQRLEDRLLTHLGLWNIHYFIVQSAAVKADLLKFKPGANFKEVPHPVYEIFSNPFTQEQARGKLKFGKEDNLLLFFGFVREYKGLHILLRALPSVLKQMPVKLIIAGEFYDDSSRYLDLIKKLNLEPVVFVFDEYIPNEDVGLYYSAADVVVLPYISATQSGIIQIAYNYNKPVITTNVGGLPEVVKEGETGFIVPAENPDALAQAIVTFYRKRKSVPFHAHIAAFKKQFSWDRMASEIESFL
ncbi:MAG: glycosyltransferase [Candidatus Zhuqueibacterota bacterium]